MPPPHASPSPVSAFRNRLELIRDGAPEISYCSSSSSSSSLNNRVSSPQSIMTVILYSELEKPDPETKPKQMKKRFSVPHFTDDNGPVHSHTDSLSERL